MGSIAGGLLGINPGAANGPTESYTPVGFTSSGLSATYTPGSPNAGFARVFGRGDSTTTPNINISRSALLNDTITGLGSAFNRQFQELGGMRDQFSGLQAQLAPGFGAITQAAVTNLENRRRSAIGNLRENLQRRRVLGSSFASDAIGRTEAEFAQQEAAIRAQAKMQEVGATEQLMARQVDLINQQAQARASEFNVQLQQLNLEAQIATQISTGVSAITAQNAQVQSQIIASGQNAVASGLLGAAGIGLGMWAMG